MFTEPQKYLLKILLKHQVEMLLLVQIILNNLSTKYQRKVFIAYQ